MEGICGYANAQGGTLYIGIDDDGNMTGLDAKTAKKLLDLEDDLISFKLMREDGQMTNAGILFADQWNVHHSRIFCTRWNGLEKTNSAQDALDDAEYTGGLIELYDNTMSFIKGNTKRGWRKDNDQRMELPDYPERALEEGLVNALIHRSYLQTGAHSQVDIYDDRLVITNPGGMFDGSDVQLLDIRHVPSKLRNPILADVFGRLKLMERRGSGFKKIMDAYEAEERYHEEIRPIFQTDGYNFFLTLWNLNYAYDKAQNKAQNKAQGDKLTNREHIMLLLRENPSLTQTELAEIMKKSRRTVQTIMKELAEEGLVERIGSKKEGKWIVHDRASKRRAGNMQ